jgi:hypothetical protein
VVRKVYAFCIAGAQEDADLKEDDEDLEEPFPPSQFEVHHGGAPKRFAGAFAPFKHGVNFVLLCVVLGPPPPTCRQQTEGQLLALDSYALSSLTSLVLRRVWYYTPGLHRHENCRPEQLGQPIAVAVLQITDRAGRLSATVANVHANASR